jgi:glutamate-1-semialdehyde 2,1-aminomutase
VEGLFAEHPGEIAAVIVEPIAGNMGLVVPGEGFLEGLRGLTASQGALLVFDEVMTGFRVHLGGAQALYGIAPDLTTLGKVIGGGLPVGAYGGRRDVMELVAPAGPVYQAGTLSGNPLAMAAGIETLSGLAEPGVWDGISRAAQRLFEGLGDAAADVGVAGQPVQAGTMLGFFFTETPIRSWEDAKEHADTERFAAFHRAMLERGVYLPPSQFEAWFLSSAHGNEEIDTTVDAAREAFALIAEGGQASA